MNFLFGLIPAIGVIAVVLYLAYVKVFSWVIARGVIAFILTITVGLSLNTYGPRVGLTKTHLPYAPESSEIETGAELIEPIDQMGQFDEELRMLP